MCRSVLNLPWAGIKDVFKVRIFMVVEFDVCRVSGKKMEKIQRIIDQMEPNLTLASFQLLSICGGLECSTFWRLGTSFSLSLSPAQLKCAYSDRTGCSRFLTSFSLYTYDPLSVLL